MIPFIGDTAVGVPVSGATQGSIFFGGSGGVLSQDNANLFWDDTNNRLLIGTATGIAIATGGNFQVVTPAIAGTAEVLSTWTMSDDATGKIQIINATPTDAFFLPGLRGTSSSTNAALQLNAAITTDSGTTSAMIFSAQRASSALTVRPLFSWTNNGTVKMQMAWDGGITHTQTINTTGSPTMDLWTGAAHTTLTASTEAIDINFNLARTVQWATTGTVATQRAFLIQAPTYASASASQTFSDAVTLAVSGPPIVGSNAIITRAWIATFGAVGTVSGLAATGIGNVGIFGAGVTQAIIRDTTNNIEVILGTQSTATGKVGTNTAHTFCILTSSNIQSQWTPSGKQIHTPSANINGVSADWVLTPSADTGHTASTEANVFIINTATKTWATTGTVALQRDFNFNALTYASASASQTFTTAATVSISGAPIAGSNAIITKGYALLVQAGDVNLAGSGSALATNATPGFPHLPTCAGTPSGVPAASQRAVLDRAVPRRHGRIRLGVHRLGLPVVALRFAVGADNAIDSARVQFQHPFSGAAGLVVRHLQSLVGPHPDGASRARRMLRQGLPSLLQPAEPVHAVGVRILRRHHRTGRPAAERVILRRCEIVRRQDIDLRRQPLFRVPGHQHGTAGVHALHGANGSHVQPSQRVLVADGPENHRRMIDIS